MPFKSG